MFRDGYPARSSELERQPSPGSQTPGPQPFRNRRHASRFPSLHAVPAASSLWDGYGILPDTQSDVLLALATLRLLIRYPLHTAVYRGRLRIHPNTSPARVDTAPSSSVQSTAASQPTLHIHTTVACVSAEYCT